MRRWSSLIAATASLAMLSACASFSPDRGMAVVSQATQAAIGEDAVARRDAGATAEARDRMRALLRKPLAADDAVRVALLSNRALQAAYSELALAEADQVKESLPPNPTLSLSRIAGGGAVEIERQVVVDILALATLPARSEFARQRFAAAQWRAVEATLRLAADVRRAHARAVAASELVALLAETKDTAEAIAKLATKLGETGGLNKLDQAREQVFYAETTAELATARQDAMRTREALTRLLGLWGDDLAYRLPQALPALPRPPTLPEVEVAAISRRADLQAARRSLAALAGSLDLTQASRFVSLLDLAGVAKTTREGGGTLRERGLDVQLQVPLFDGGEVRVRQAAETYNAAVDRLADQAIRARSEAREAYRAYRASHDIARHYQSEVLPLRKVIAQEMQLRFSGMQVDVFTLVTEARQRVAAQRAAIAARRDVFLAQADLSAAIHGGGRGDAAEARPATTAAAE